jgi:hypothetical protein
MAKISNEARQQYFERIKEYKQISESILQREKSLLKIVKGQSAGAAYKYITLAEERLNLASYFLLQNALSMTLLGVKNDAYLNDARKSCYQAVIYLEEVVSNYIDVPFSDYSDLLEEIDGYEDEKRYHLVRKIGFTIDAVEEAYGPNSKWRWSFVELEGRFAAVAKNLVNFKTFIAQMDPSLDGYSARMGQMELVQKLLIQAADRYREKYELSTLRIDDFKRAIAFLAALKRIHTIFGEAEKADEIKRKMDVWKSKMESDEKTHAKKKNV